MTPPMTAGRPNSPLAARIGAMKAKLEARNTGTWRLVTSWNSRVPIPAVNSATLGSMPVISGISTRAPKATKSICAPEMPWRHSGSLNSVCDMSGVLLLGAEDLVASVAQARNDVAIFVQALVDGGGEDGHVRVGLFDSLDTLGRSDQDHGANVLAACLLQQVDGSDHRATGGQHRVDDQGQARVDFRCELFQIGVGFEGFLVARHAHGADLGARDQAEHAVEHANAGTQN